MPLYEFIDGASVLRVGHPGNSFIKTFLFTVSLIRHLLCDTKKTDIIHSHGAVAMGAIGRIISILSGAKNMVKIASAGRILKYKNKIFGMMMLCLFKQSDAIIGMTKEIQKELENIGTPANTIFSITNAVNGKRFQPYTQKQRKTWKMRRSLDPSTPVILFMSRLVPEKGLFVLLDAWRRVVQSYPQVHLIILGSGFGQAVSVETQLKRKVENEAISNVSFEGETDSPESYLGAADIFVFPSRHEGFPNALLEAMASGLAIVASDIGGVVELIDNDKTGLLFPSGNDKMLADKIIYLLEHPDIRYRMALQARRHVLKNYSFEKIAKQYMETYRRISS